MREIQHGGPPPQENKEENRIKEWGKIKRWVESTTDVNGLEIEKGIKDLVIGLNAHEITTTGSCEGHPDQDFVGSWVDIGDNPPDEIIKKMEALDLEKNKMTPDEVIDKIPEIKQFQEKNLVMTGKVKKLLEDFYHNKEQGEKYKIELEQPTMHGNTRLFYGDESENLSPSEREKALNQGRQEMQEFAHYLRSKFLLDK